MPIVKTQREVADCLGVTPQCVGQWKKHNPDFPFSIDGYDVEKIRSWVAEREKKGSEAAQESSDVTRLTKEEKLKKLKNDTRLQDFEFAAMQREFLPRQMIHDIMLECGNIIREIGINLQRSGNIQAAKIVNNGIDQFQKVVNDRLASRRTAS